MERKVDADIFPTLTDADKAQPAATAAPAKEQVARSAAEVLKQSKRLMVWVWVLTVVCAFLVFGRQAVTGTKPTVIMYIAVGVLFICAIASTEGFIRYSRGKGKHKRGGGERGGRRSKG